jgi:hypothetical protein
MGEASVKKKKKQSPLKVNTQVFFIGFTKHKKQKPTFYMCKGIVIESPNPMTMAPHKLKILSVGISPFHSGGFENDGRSLIGKTCFMPLDRLHQELHSWTTPLIWWS